MAEFSHRSLHGAKAGRRRLLIATLIIVALVALDTFSGGFVRTTVRSVSARLWTSSAKLRTSIAESGILSGRASLARENMSLKDELAHYREKAAGYDVLLSENAALRAMQRLSELHAGITAPVVSSSRSSPYGTFLVGAGVEDTVARGDLVLTDGGFVVGLVADVQRDTTEVRSLFAAGVQTDALISGTAVTVVGDGGGNAHAGVPRGIVMKTGDPVIAKVYGGRAIGIVGRVESSPTSAEQTVYIRLPVDLAALRYVYILHE